MFSGNFSDTIKDLIVGGILLGAGGFVGWVWTIDHAVSESKIEASDRYLTKEDFKEFRVWLADELREINLTFREIKEKI